ncbi:MAG: hypothetical protein EB150_07650 [Nitrososphaeria archaeon]|nr:hypothetical protein [Nitrososphaeria archaeon]NDB51425.1 hypothetical protein [Nitrosopumilaceae archaeon]NDB90038.1 hypothetical protein [Nitrososphaerota archaeon]NDB46828.1 hypothetical protein [Nitrososphaeria archaeon]NDB63753.1 hypothetical protein [Nitrosopumilaceae archaeon]
MPLTNQVIIMLNEITTQVKNKKSLTTEDESLIKETFNKILSSGQYYDVDEIESWFNNEGTWTHKPTIVRITNMSHYVQSRFEQAPKKLKIVSDSDCDC